MRIDGLFNQLLNLPETMWKTLSRPQDLAPETNRILAIATVGLVGIGFLYHRYQKTLDIRTTPPNPISPNRQSEGYSRLTAPTGDDIKSEEEKKEKQPDKNVALASAIRDMKKKQAPAENEQAISSKKKASVKKKAIRVLTPEEIKKKNRRDFTFEEMERRLKRSFLRAQLYNDSVFQEELGGERGEGRISYVAFPFRLDNCSPGRKYFESIPKKALQIHTFDGVDAGQMHLYGSAQMQGLRASMEDRAYCGSFSYTLSNGQSLPICFFSLFDGHNGAQGADFFKSKIHPYAKEALSEVKFGEDDERLGIVNAITKLYIPITEELLRDRDMDVLAKTMAISAFKIRRCLYVANAGDSRAIVIDGKKTFALSRDHRPEVCEKSIRERGGSITKLENGALAVIGSWWKAFQKGLSAGRAAGYPEVGTGINPRAEVIEYELEEESDEPQFLVLCCDGVWDAMSTNQVGDLVRRHHNEAPGEIATIILKQAYCQNSYDNLTALVIPLNKAAEMLPDGGEAPGARAALSLGAPSMRLT